MPSLAEYTALVVRVIHRRYSAHRCKGDRPASHPESKTVDAYILDFIYPRLQSDLLGANMVYEEVGYALQSTLCIVEHLTWLPCCNQDVESSPAVRLTTIDFANSTSLVSRLNRRSSLAPIPGECDVLTLTAWQLGTHCACSTYETRHRSRLPRPEY